MSKIREYAQQIPEEMKRAISGFDNDFRVAIFVALYKYGELSFSDLQKKLQVDKAKLNFHLKKLSESALVEHYYRHELGNVEFSFYSITGFGVNFVRSLIQSLAPEPPFKMVPTKRYGSDFFASFLSDTNVTLKIGDLTKIVEETFDVPLPAVSWIATENFDFANNLEKYERVSMTLKE